VCENICNKNVFYSRLKIKQTYMCLYNVNDILLYLIELSQFDSMSYIKKTFLLICVLLKLFNFINNIILNINIIYFNFKLKF